MAWLGLVFCALFEKAVHVADGLLQFTRVELIVGLRVHAPVKHLERARTALLHDGAIGQREGIEEVVAREMPVAGRVVVEVMSHGQVGRRVRHAQHLVEQGGKATLL